MRLIGMLDSPYVRRVAISAQLLGLTFEHRPLSVFRNFEAFRQINPAVKAPTLVCEDGTVLMESSLILQYLEARAGRSLLPNEAAQLPLALRRIGLALTACEKTVQIVYEGLRQPAQRDEAWLKRINGQLHAAYAALEAMPAAKSLDQAGLTTAVAWRFTQFMTPGAIEPDQFPQLAAWSAQAETTDAFQRAACGDGTYPVTNSAPA